LIDLIYCLSTCISLCRRCWEIFGFNKATWLFWDLQLR